MSDAVKDAGGAAARPVAGDGAAARDPWTPEQRLAIETRGRNLLVSAAAGSGKTSVLVRRVIERMLDPRQPVDIDRMLVVTFTEAAAAEMRDRIRRTLEAEMEKRPADMRLRRQVGLLARASISTLHAFCLTVIRQYHYRIDLDPGFQVIDDHEALLLRQDVLEDVLEARYAAGGEAFRALVDAYGRRDDETLRQFVLGLHDLAVSQPWPDAWLDGLVARFDEAAGRPVEASPWMEPLRALARREAEQAILHVEEALRLCALPGGPADRAGILETDRERLREVAQTVTAGTWEEIRAALAADWPRFTGSRDVDPILLERVQKHRKRAKDRLERLSRQVFHSDAAAVTADLARMRALAAELVDLVRAFGEAFAAAKAELGVVDFADMERLALRVLLDPDARPGELRPSPAAKELRERFDEVLVDEYQDINEVQDAILRLVARDGEDGAPNLFMVGDVKQSIYRFRLAEPGLFLRKYATFPPLRPGGEPGVRDARIDLNANFRSRRSVVDAVNFVFRQLMTPTAGGIAYDESAQLVAAADYPAPDAAVPEGAAGEAPVEVHLLERRPGSEPWPGSNRAAEDGGDRDDAGDEPGAAYEDAEALEALEREALLVARRIRALVHGEAGQPPLHVWDKDLRAYRPVRHRDIVVLLRSVKWKAPAFAEMLAREGVPVYTRAGGGYFATMEIELMLA
ncbi:MAG: UvrD-helicase domain-containing protein, partial [Clostridia bacterium]|nr:UvrD-helicase domain-containing protein [Clostridia bacterium]